MNIQTASHYANCGLKIRRPLWKNSIYLDAQGAHPHSFVYAKEAYFYFELDDLLADDWELAK